MNLPLIRPIEGDFVAGFDHRGLLTKNMTKVTSRNIDIVDRALKRGQVVVIGPVMGSSITIPENQWGDTISKILNDLKVDKKSFSSPNYPELSSKGLWRPLGILPKDFSYSILHDKEDQNKLVAEVSFDLPRGTYATVVLREIMKTNPMNYV
jgi:tRNA pseudouridine13 synthase